MDTGPGESPFLRWLTLVGFGTLFLTILFSGVYIFFLSPTGLTFDAEADPTVAVVYNAEKDTLQITKQTDAFVSKYRVEVIDHETGTENTYRWVSKTEDRDTVQNGETVSLLNKNFSSDDRVIVTAIDTTEDKEEVVFNRTLKSA